MDEAKIREHLDRADRSVKRGQELLERQEERVEELAVTVTQRNCTKKT